MSMTANEHIEAAERIIEGMDLIDTSDPDAAQVARDSLQLAQVHATLALAKGEMA